MIKDDTPLGAIAREIGLTTRMLNIFADYDIKTFGQFMAFIPSTKYRNMGAKTVREIVAIQYSCNSEREQKQPDKEIDWEERRYEIAKTAIHAQITGPIIPGVDPNPSIPNLAKWAVNIADALISELKKGGEK